MKKDKDKKLTYFLRAAMMVLTTILIVLFLVIMSMVGKIQGTARVVNYAGLVRGGTQRMVKLEISGAPQDKMYETISSYIEGLRNGSEKLNFVRLDDEVSGEVYTTKTFQKFVKENFSSYITSQVFKEIVKPEKIYFSLKACDGGYSLLAADSDSEKTYAWISSLSKRFSLVEMIATGVVYVKDTRTDTYQPFISANGKYCHYDKEKGILVEI